MKELLSSCCNIIRADSVEAALIPDADAAKTRDVISEMASQNHNGFPSIYTVTFLHENARMRVRPNRWRAWHLAKVGGGRLQRAQQSAVR